MAKRKGQLPRGRIPDLDRSVGTRRGNQSAIGAKGDRQDGAGMAGQRQMRSQDIAPISDAHDLDPSIAARHRQPVTVRTKSDARDKIGSVRQFAGVRVALPVEELNTPIASGNSSAHGEQIAFWVEGHRADARQIGRKRSLQGRVRGRIDKDGAFATGEQSIARGCKNQGCDRNPRGCWLRRTARQRHRETKSKQLHTSSEMKLPSAMILSGRLPPVRYSLAGSTPSNFKIVNAVSSGRTGRSTGTSP